MVTNEEITKLVHKYVGVSKDALRTFCPEFYYDNLVIRIDHNMRRVTHTGGKYAKGFGINMSSRAFRKWFTFCIVGNGYSHFQEYSHIKNDPIIGDAFVNTLEQWISIATGHEVAHACQSYLEFRDKKDTIAHGKEFQEIYQKIRLVINKNLPDQYEAQQSYKALMNFIKERELYDT